MIAIIVTLLAIGGATAAYAEPPPVFTPYSNPAANQLYNLLFCDRLELFRGSGNESPSGVWIALLAANPDPQTLRAIAEDAAQESRTRMLAYNRLREMKQPVPAKELLGVIIEVGLDQGLDVLAAFPDGRVRYLNHAGGMSIFEASPPEVAAKVAPLLAASRNAVERTGPWDKARLAPPANEMMRMTFLVSDGLYFGQGPLAQMQTDPLAAPVVAASMALLQAVVAKSLERGDEQPAR
jgi:hypothetical protein